MNILERIVAQKRVEVADRRERTTLKALESKLAFSAPTLSLCEYLSRPGSVGVIAEIKRRSPSAGDLRPFLAVEDISVSYMRSGASALSVLTDESFFGGSLKDLETARHFNLCPILRKDFIIDEFQVYEARAFGADVILLSAAILEDEQALRLARLARSLGMEVLFEVHSLAEIESAQGLLEEVDLVGFNSRDLKDFSVDTQRAMEAIGILPDGVMKVAESGISKPETIAELHQAGYRGFLIGEHFVTAASPGDACSKLIGEVRRLAGI